MRQNAIRFALSWLLLGISLSAQTTVNITNTVINTVTRPYILFGDEAPYGSGHHLRDFGVPVGGYMPGEYWQFVAQCKSGVTQTTTSWTDTAAGGASAYPANFWVNAAYTAYDYQGNILGTGTITASTANTGGSPITFTLSTPMTAACQTAHSADMLEVRFFNAPDSLAQPTDIFGTTSGTLTWNTSILDPATSNTVHTLQLAAGASLQLGFDQGLGNSTNTTSTSGVPWININGTGYLYKLAAQCLAASGTGSLQVGLARGSTTYVSTRTLNPACSNSASFTPYSFSFNGTETGSQTGNLIGAITNTGSTPILVSYETVIEPTSMTPANTTPYRDSVVQKLGCGTNNGVKGLCVGGLRQMDVAGWGGWAGGDLQLPAQGMRWNSVSSFVKNNFFPATSPTDFLNLCLYLGVDAWITVGQHNQPADVTSFVNWLHTSNAWDTKFAAIGKHIYIEVGNEAWNSGAAGNLWGGDGPIYGNLLGVDVAAAHSAANWNSASEDIIGDGWVAGSQGCSVFGWNRNVLTEAATVGSKPDILGVAPYTFNYWANFTASGSDLSPTSSSIMDMLAEIDNFDLVATCGPPTSMLANNNYVSGVQGTTLGVYEVNISDNQGVATPTQTIMNEQSRSVATALAQNRHLMLMRDGAGVAGPISLFTLSGNSNSYTCTASSGCVSGVVMPQWGVNRMMGDGPGQTGFTKDTPTAQLFGLINNSIGSKNKSVSVTASWPTYSYPGGQPKTGDTTCGPAPSNTICPNAAARKVDCHANTDGSNNYSVVCFNVDPTLTAQSITLTGNVPSGSVTQTIFPPSGNIITDNNEQTWLGATSTVVGDPTPTTTSGNSYTIPAASALILNFSTSGGATAGSSVNGGITMTGGVKIQ